MPVTTNSAKAAKHKYPGSSIIALPEPSRAPTAPGSLTFPPFLAAAGLSRGSLGPGWEAYASSSVEPGTQLTSLAPGTGAPPLLRGRKLPGSGPPKGQGGAITRPMGRRPAGDAPRPGNHRLWGVIGPQAEARRGANHGAELGNTAHPAAPIANPRPEAGRPEDIQINSTSSLLPAPSRKRKKKAAETRIGASHSARPAPIRPSDQWLRSGLIRTFHGDAAANQKNVEAGRSQYANRPLINVAAKPSFW